MDGPAGSLDPGGRLHYGTLSGPAVVGPGGGAAGTAGTGWNVSPPIHPAGVGSDGVERKESGLWEAGGPPRPRFV